MILSEVWIIPTKILEMNLRWEHPCRSVLYYIIQYAQNASFIFWRKGTFVLYLINMLAAPLSYFYDLAETIPN